METTLIDWQRTCKSEEDHSRTAVIIAPSNTFLFHDASDFAPYGAVETTRSGDTSGSSYVVIQFKDATHAMDLIAKRFITLKSYPFKVIPFRSNDEFTELVENITFTHPPYYAPPPPDRSEDNILNALNDDCLGEIFKRADLSERDEIEKVCTRFKRVAEKGFLSVYKRNKIYFTKWNPDGKVILTDIEKFLHHFWPSVVSVDLSDNKDEHASDKFYSILKLMAKYCSNLKRLSVRFNNRNNKEVENQTLIEIRPLLSKLNSFSISHILLSDCNAFITACDEMEHLSVVFREADSVLPEITFSTLKTCWFIGINSSILEGFLSHNPQIEKLDFYYDFDALRAISEKLPNVREMNIFGIDTRLTNLDNLRLKSLKQAKINMSFGNSELLLANSIENLSKNITDLYLPFRESFDFNVIIELTKHLYNLETLEIFNFSGEHILPMENLKEMLRYAKKMTELKFHSIVHEFCEKDYNEILEIVKSRNNHPLKLNIELCNERRGTYGNKRKKIFFNANPQWLTITNCYQF